VIIICDFQVVLAACVCAASAQGLVGGYAGAFNPAPSSQFHAQDEFGQFSFGHAGGPSARTEARNAYGVTTGSYQYIDANGLLQTVNYIADPVNGFRVAGTNLPVAPVVGAVVDTPEVAAAKAELAVAYAAAAAAAAAVAVPEEPAAEEAVAEERKRRAADEVAAPAALPAVLPYPYAGAYGVGAGLFGGVYAAAPGAIVANIAHAAPTVAAPLAYAGLGAPLAYAGLGAPLAYAGAAPLAYAGAAPLAYAGAAHLAYAAPLASAAPSREAVLTTIKLNPGHAISYRVD